MDYGSLPAVQADHGPLWLDDSTAKQRRTNQLAWLKSFLIPSLLFMAMLSLMTFSVHDRHPATTWFLTACGFLLPLGFATKSYQQYHKELARPTSGPRQTWYNYLFVSTLVAWIAGAVLGDLNFSSNMGPYYKAISTGTILDVDPTSPGYSGGGHYFNMNRVIFTNSSIVDGKLSLGYKDADLYCVAPITSSVANGIRPEGYDFWAVGINCCYPMQPAAFWCSDANAKGAGSHAGLRYKGDPSNFRRAIEMAAAEHNFNVTKNPILFTWLRDPVAEIEALQLAGLAQFKMLTVVVVAIFFAASFAYLSNVGGFSA